MKNWLLAAVMLLAGSSAFAFQPTVNQDTSNNLLAPAFAQNLDYNGCVPFRVEATTVPTLIASGSGVFYELNASSGTSSSAYSVAYDSGVIGQPIGSATYALGVNAVAQLQAGVLISPKVYTTGSTASAPSNGSFVPSRPRAFFKGLVVANSDAGLYTSGCYRTSSSPNP